MTKECELLLAIVARQNCGSACNIVKEIRGTSNRQILKQRPPHFITKRAR